METMNPDRVAHSIFVEPRPPRRQRWDALQHTFQSRGKPKDYTRPVEGWDTETQDGYTRILSSSKTTHLIHDFDDMLRILGDSSNRGVRNFFYNLHYDVESWLKYEKETAWKVAFEGRATYNTYKITYIPRKMLTIRTPGKHAIYYYDVAQFYRESLAAASKRFLGEEPHAFKGDRARLFEVYPVDEIMDYCRDDARRARLLGERYMASLAQIGLYPRHTISSGNIAAQACLKWGDMPTCHDVPQNILADYWETFRGGWTEVYKRGVFRAWDYDISSAYPGHMRDFPDVRDGKWRTSWDDGDPFGVLTVEIEASAPDLLPVGFWSHGLLTYAHIDMPVRTHVTISEYRAYRHHYKMRILHGYGWRPDPQTRFPFREVVDRLYRLKQSNKSDPGVYRATKELINSIYGKTAERVRLPTGQYRLGRLTHPVYASETTARTRIQVWETARQRPQDIIAIFTDSLISRRPLTLPHGDGMGAWETRHEKTPCLMLRPGLYQFAGESPKHRGATRINSLWEICDTAAPHVTLHHQRPQHLRECHIQERWEDVGTFKEMATEISLRDRKRLWPNGPYVLSDILHKTYNSTPVPASFLHHAGQLLPDTPAH